MQGFKKTVTSLIIFIATVTTANAQIDLIAGIGGTYELENELYGVNGRLYYGVNRAFCFGPEVSIFPFQSTEDGIETSVIDLNLNAHYIFEVTEKLGIYPLAGINYTIEEERLIENTNNSEEEEEFGINYGLGAHYNIAKNLFLFAEFKGIIGRLKDEFLTIGLIIDFTKKETD